jgi:hypothetical protein
MVVARLPQRLFPPSIPIPPGLKDEITSIASGDLAAIARVLEMTGRLVGLTEAKHADANFINGLVHPEDDPALFDREAAIEVLDLIMTGQLSSTDVDRALWVLERALGPNVSDLIFYPPKPGLTSAEVHDLALAHGPPPSRPAMRSLRAARHALAAMAMNEEIELIFGEMAAQHLARVIDTGVSQESIAAWSTRSDNHLGEVFAIDDILLQRVQASIAARPMAASEEVP